MDRRTFLTLLGGGGLAAGAAWLLRPQPVLPPPSVGAQGIDRLDWWPLTTSFPPVALEWRYLAGRITTGGEDYGLVVSLSNFNEIPNPLSPALPPLQAARSEMLVMFEDFAGNDPHATESYVGSLAYTPGTAAATYSFNGTSPNSNAVGTATLAWQSTNNVYTLTFSSPVLSLNNLTLRPLGDLIPEGGDGNIPIAQFAIGGVTSRYHADWVTIEQNGEPVGHGRLDIQDVRPTGPSSGFSHHWFAVATQIGTAEVRVSFWELVSNTTYWAVTIARRDGDTWSITPYTEESDVDHPLDVQILEWQIQPEPDGSTNAPPRRTGKRWRIRMGQTNPGDVIDLTIGVSEGQFIDNGRVANESTGITYPMQEAVGLDASGTVSGAAIGAVRLAVAESTYSEEIPEATATPTATRTGTPTRTTTGTPPTATRTGTPTRTTTGTPPTATRTGTPTRTATGTPPTATRTGTTTPSPTTTTQPGDETIYLPVIE